MADIPTAPLIVSVDQVKRVSGGGSVTIRMSWMQPHNFDQFDIDHYIINVTSTSGVQVIACACRCTSTVMIMSENPNNVQINTTFTAAIAAVNLCGETGPTGTASYALSTLLLHNQLFRINCS